MHVNYSCMPVLITYLIKLSLGLTVIWLFYQMVLRRLTFYRANRWYLLVYTLFCFGIPFLDITPWLDRQSDKLPGWVRVMPAVDSYTPEREINLTPASTGFSYSAWDFLEVALLAGTVVLLVRLLVRLASLYRLRRRASLVADRPFRLFQVNAHIMPFSFGDSVFINRSLHTEKELQDIIRHEIVHVRQRHTLDILWGEFLCIVQWYNPFAWLLRAAIRQNLEFIADHQALASGIDRREYQYLLLKVIGNNHYSIAQQFNFSSLKKRIAMMNKLRSARIHLVKFLFGVPLAAVLLLAFRSRWEPPPPVPAASEQVVNLAGIVVDSKTREPLAGVSIRCSKAGLETTTDARGYYLLRIPFEDAPLQFSLDLEKPGFKALHQQENWGNFTEPGIRALYGNSFEFFGLGRTAHRESGFSTLFGKGLKPEDLSPEMAAQRLRKVLKEMDEPDYGEDSEEGQPGDDSQKPAAAGNYLHPDHTDTFPDGVNDKGYRIAVKGGKSKATVVVRDKDHQLVEEIPMATWREKKTYYENKYGKLPPPPPLPPLPPMPPVNGSEDAASLTPPEPPAPPVPLELPEEVEAIDVHDKQATVQLKTGIKEKYNLAIEAEKTAFEKKYGPLVTAPPPPVGVKNPGRPLRPLPRIEGAPEPVPAPVPLPENVKRIEIKQKKATVVLIDGTTENYNLNIETEKAAFEKKYGMVPSPPRRPA